MAVCSTRSHEYSQPRAHLQAPPLRVLGDLRPSCVLDISGAVPEDRLGLIFDTCRKNDLDRTQVYAHAVLPLLDEYHLHHAPSSRASFLGLGQ
jgi:hypothetical protein